MNKTLKQKIIEELISIRHEFRLMPDITEYFEKQSTKHKTKTAYIDMVLRSLMSKGFYIEEPWTHQIINNISAEWENRKNKNNVN